MISDECKAYERFATNAWQDDPFPMAKHKLIRYIKNRARSSTFPTFMSNLDIHPLHGPTWFQMMNTDPDVRQLMKATANLWPRQVKEYKLPLIGLSPINRNNGKAVVKTKEEIELENVRVVQGPKAKGFMVADENMLSIKAPAPSQLSSNALYLPTPRVTNTFYTEDNYDPDELEVIGAKEFHGMDLDIIDSFEEGSNSSTSSKKHSKQDEEEFNYDMDYTNINDFEVDLGDFHQSDIDFNAFDDVKNFTTGEDITAVNDMDEDLMCQYIEMETRKAAREIDMLELEEEEEDNEPVRMKEPIIFIEMLRRPIGRPRIKPIAPKRPVGRPRKVIIIPEPKVVIESLESLSKEEQVQDLEILDV